MTSASTPAGSTKALHVSPFLPMALEYRWRLSRPGRQCGGGDRRRRRRAAPILQTGVAMRRRPLTGATMARLLVSHPPMSLRVLGGIYWQALHLWRKRVPYHPHPHHLAEEHLAA